MARGGLTSETRILREIKTSHNTYTQLQSICVGKGAINTKTQAHKLINTLCDLTPTLKQLFMPGTDTEIGLRAAKSLAIRGLALRDSIELVTWLHGLPVTGAKGFLNLMRDSPRATVLHVLEGCKQIALLNLVTQGYLPKTPLREFGGHPVGHQRIHFVLVFSRDLFPRLTYMQNLITHIQKGSASLPRTTLNIITYDPLKDIGNGRLPRQRPYTTYPEFRPTVKRGIYDNPYARVSGEPPDKDLEYDNLVELYGYDEERGLSELVLVKGTMIEVPFKNEYGEPIWVKGRVSSTTEGSLKFKFRIQGEMDHENWAQTLSRADMESTWRLPPTTRRRLQGVHAILSTQGYTPWHHSHHGSHWLRLQPRGAWKYKTHNVHGSLQDDVFGWRIGHSMMHKEDYCVGDTEFTIKEFTMCSFAEDHMSKEDLGVGATTQEWADLQNLGRELIRWDNLPMDSQARNKWSQVPPRAPDHKEPRPRPRGRKDKGKDQTQPGPLAPLGLDPKAPMTQSAGTCLSGCTLLANATGGIPMREIRPGTFLLNAKGNPVKVTNVYFSMENLVMVQISPNCHITLTHPVIDTRPVRRQYRKRPRSTQIVTTAAEWHTRRHTDICCFPPPNALRQLREEPHPMSEELHPSSPHNLRRGRDLWGFSTEQNQAVRSFDDPSCLICPIGHSG